MSYVFTVSGASQGVSVNIVATELDTPPLKFDNVAMFVTQTHQTIAYVQFGNSFSVHQTPDGAIFSTTVNWVGVGSAELTASIGKDAQGVFTNILVTLVALSVSKPPIVMTSSDPSSTLRALYAPGAVPGTQTSITT